MSTDTPTCSRDDLAYDFLGSFISFVPGQLADNTGETQSERFILQRPPA